ncbi:hypothetical protein HanPI659440_Chr00c06g0716161 [Helianthus annuus]|nr:hypothetical protein HanPI659440_Chr00c06g0716161 [Helianthus annuus]
MDSRHCLTDALRLSYRRTTRQPSSLLESSLLHSLLQPWAVVCSKWYVMLGFDYFVNPHVITFSSFVGVFKECLPGLCVLFYDFALFRVF